MRFLFAAALLVVSSACMLNPVDGQVVSSMTAAQSFGGYSNTASQSVRLEWGTGVVWNDAGVTTTSATSSFVEDDVLLYGWNINTALPAAAWGAGTTGHFAKVRMVVPPTTAGGTDTFMYSFKPDWSACRAANPGLSNFISRCKSPRSPVAYLYTSDFPAGADFTVSLLWTSLGRTEVRVRNNGRPGIVTRITCSRFGSASELTVSEPLAPGDSKSFFSAVAPAGTVTCSATGTNEDGTPEANTSNNQATRFF